MLVQIATRGWRYFKERAITLPYHFKSRQGSHDEMRSIRGVTLIYRCTKTVGSAGVFSSSMRCLYCPNHQEAQEALDEDDTRCPCPLPTDGSRCPNRIVGGGMMIHPIDILTSFLCLTVDWMRITLNFMANDLVLSDMSHSYMVYLLPVSFRWCRVC
jgi:hypothetical protein